MIQDDDRMVSFKIKKNLVKEIDSIREISSMSRTTFILQALIEKLERLGVEVRDVLNRKNDES